MLYFRPGSNLTGRLLIVFAWLMSVLDVAAQTPYVARIEGVDDPALLDLLQEVSTTLASNAETPRSHLHLRRRAEGDVQSFLDVFRSRGYYGAEVEYMIDRDRDPVEVLFRAEPGTLFLFGAVAVAPEGESPGEGVIPTPSELGLAPGAPALADAILAADGILLSHLRERGYPAPEIARRDVVVDPEAHTVDVTFHLRPGPRATYGAPRYEGLAITRPLLVDRLLPWKPGDTFDHRQLGELRTRLYDTGLFSTASAEALPAEIGPDGVVPVQISVTERPPRTIGAGLEYKSDEGAGTRFNWEHRNLKGLGHELSVKSTLATELRELGLGYRVPRYRRMDQNLGLSLSVAQEEREAYDSERIDTLAMIDRTVNPRLTLAGGAGLRVGRVTQLGEENSHELIYFPMELRLDKSDDALDPTAGFKFRARLEPYVDFLGDFRQFTKADVEFSHYLSFGELQIGEGKTLPNWVLATRARLGAMAGEERDDIPADIRFYGGGGGSIRGYRFQTVSPLEGDDPIGGRSLAEFSIELRRRISETLGIVAFVDAGGAFESPWPDFSGGLRYGAGLGVRYYTPLGPLRFDLAVPLNKRDKIDDAFQIYLSIGHAF